MNLRNSILSLPASALVAAWVLCALGFSSQVDAADNRFWTLTPYKVRILLAVETTGLPSQTVAEHIASYLTERSDAVIGPMWNLEIEALAGNERLDVLQGVADERLTEWTADPEHLTDKLMVLTIRETPTGGIVSGVECDRLLARIGQRQSMSFAQLSEAGETAFALLRQLFSPVAIFTVDRSTGEDVTLSFRGSKLPVRTAAPEWATPGTVLMPILRRTDREGNVVEDGVQAAPWTYLLISDQPVENGIYHADIYSHTKRPFGVRRRGRVEQYAVLLQPSTAPTRIHLHARDEPDQPLSGYQAFVQDGDADQRDLIGTTDADGMIEVEHGSSPMQIVFIKSGSQVVAKAPIPVGTIPQVDIPLLDERKRLEAEAKLSLLREDLIDLVARRSILAARIESLITKGKHKEAQKLLDQLDGMPGRAQFNQKLVRVQQQSKSRTPEVQQRIDKLFAEMAAVLGAFLSTEDVQRLRSKLAELPATGS